VYRHTQLLWWENLQQSKAVVWSVNKSRPCSEDNTVLIYAGDAIDNSVGVAFGLSSLAAAAMVGLRFRV